MHRLSFCIFFLLLGQFGFANAGFDESVKALNAKDFQGALIEAKKGAESNDSRAFYLLGEIYRNGYGVEKNAVDAYSWYEKAAKGGVLVAVSKLAMAYARGEGVAKDTDKALALARYAAKNNDPEGMFLVNIFLQNSHLSFIDENGHADNEKY